MLSNAYLLAKIRFDTAENKPAKNLQISATFAAADHATVLSVEEAERRSLRPSPSKSAATAQRAPFASLVTMTRRVKTVSATYVFANFEFIRIWL